MLSARILLILVSEARSVLSPILFACFIIDVGDHARNCRFHLYADNLQIYTATKINS
jgi:hypothetical protein